jgi:UDP-2,3-diacylglucosamine pyrophosphatase LpxH
MRACGVRTLIHGHTHRPDIHHFDLDGQSAQRIVLGAWYEQGSLLRVEPEHRYTLLTLDRDAATRTQPGTGSGRHLSG